MATKQQTDLLEPTAVRGTPSEECKLLLKGWRRPAHAYVLMETRERQIQPDGSLVAGVGLFTFNVEHRPDQAHKIEMYESKGYKVIDYGNFPAYNDANPSRAKLAKMHTGPDGINPWDELAKICNRKLKSEEVQAAKVRGIQAKLDEANKKLEALSKREENAKNRS